MPRNRFKELMRMLRFDDKSTRSERKAKDKLAAFREIWDEFLVSLRRYYIPGKNLTVDEQLMPFRGRCSFIQYLPSKPDRYGIKLFWAVDSSNSYPLTCIPYLGKDGRTPHVGLGRDMVMQLTRPFYGSNRNVTADNYFTDMDLAKHLLSNGLTLVGTVKANKRFIPEEFREKSELYHSDFAFLPNVTLVSYQSKKNKKVTLISTMHDTADVDGSPKKKPEMVNYYNSTKSGVDTLDQMAHCYTTKRKTNRWPVVMFFNMIDVAGIAANISWSLKFPDPSGWKRYVF